MSAIFLAVLLGLAGLGIDLGYIQFQQPAQQSAAGTCLYVLGAGISTAGVDFDAPRCGVVVNGPVSSSGGIINAGYFGYSGTLSNTGTTFSGAQPTQMAPAVNPCPNIAGCNYLTNNAPTGTSMSSFIQSGGSLALRPGTYGSLSLSGVNLTLSPGLYVFTGNVSDAGGTITGSGVTIYQRSGGFSSNGASDSLSACTASCSNGAVSGVLYFQPARNSSGSNFSGASATYDGLVYAPSSAVYMSGSGRGYAIYVVGSASLAGGTFSDTPTQQNT